MPPNLPVHCPFLKWIPKTVALTPEDIPDGPSYIEITSDDDDEPEKAEIGGAQDPSEDPGSDEETPSALPFQMGPTPPLVKNTVPIGIPKNYPRGNLNNLHRTHGTYTGPNQYVWSDVVSIYSVEQLF